MRLFKGFSIVILCGILLGCNTEKKVQIKVLQFNVWQEGTVIEGGFNAMIDIIIQTEADVIALSEVRNYNGIGLDETMVDALKTKGYTFYSERSQDSGILSKYAILEMKALVPVTNDHGSITKAIIDIEGVEMAFYSGHLDYLNCALYLPRGYDGSTWKKLDAPVLDVVEIEKVNLASQRDEAILVFIDDAKQEIAKGRLVMYGGDNNEPSHLDWTKATKNLFDHNGVEMVWNNTFELENNGFIDVYREKYPDPVTHPGFTFPANTLGVPIEKLAWSPDADDRDRIDFIFYYPDNRLTLQDVKLVGPEGDIVKNKRVLIKTEDVFLKPLSIWPTDHKAVLASFDLIFD